MTISDCCLHLTERVDSVTINLPIDIFFRSLADDQRDRAVGIVLSGTGSDGTLGLREIRENGGMVMVQEPESARFDGMPRGALATGLVDFVLPPGQMPETLLKFLQHPFVTKRFAADQVIVKDQDFLARLFLQLKNGAGVDFTHYKRSTVLRRIERRISINQLENPQDYVTFMEQDKREQTILCRELLIGVTKLFRDPGAFTCLRESVLPQLFDNRQPGDSIRFWVAGCSTGEEAYSLAMLVNEDMAAAGTNFDVKIFATDIDRNASRPPAPGPVPKAFWRISRRDCSTGTSPATRSISGSTITCARWSSSRVTTSSRIPPSTRST
ncbi:MAG: hypothetical protein JW781_05840 [Deltaproteobacteria bacterium]|nr:hypothetical protein [Candidatus Anaeroferrophillacea bacterium]